ncbi:hypothetical protein DFH09DRAFT_1377289 [Mycena vulgaris]|nr:hypothetical protein DFH09DRAFT_1377289 [Mycena vulgaris]
MHPRRRDVPIHFSCLLCRLRRRADLPAGPRLPVTRPVFTLRPRCARALPNAVKTLDNTAPQRRAEHEGDAAQWEVDGASGIRLSTISAASTITPLLIPASLHNLFTFVSKPRAPVRLGIGVPAAPTAHTPDVNPGVAFDVDEPPEEADPGFTTRMLS